MFEVPITVSEDTPALDLSIDILGKRYTLGLHWNRRLEAWILDVSNDTEVVSHGIALRADRPLIGIEGGVLIAWDTSGKHSDPGFDELGNRVRLYFVEPSDIV